MYILNMVRSKRAIILNKLFKDRDALKKNNNEK